MYGGTDVDAQIPEYQRNCVVPGQHIFSKMPQQLSEDESELFALADSVLRKVSAMDDAAFEKLNLYPD